MNAFQNNSIDHLLQIVDSEVEAYRLASATGLNIMSKTVHTGQGTSGIFLIFEECYFEYIWLRDAEEAKNNPLRFDKKFLAIKDGGSPFGVALKGNIAEQDLNQFTSYKPAYGKYTINFTKESLANPLLPLVFVMSHPDRPNSEDWHPIKSDGRNNSLCNFDSLIKRFNSVEIQGPHLSTHPFPCIKTVKSNEHKMIISSGVNFKFSEIVGVR